MLPNIPRMLRPRRRKRDDTGASGLEYGGLLALAALILGSLAIIIPNPVGTQTKAAICRIINQGDKASCPVGQSAARIGKCAAFCPTRDHPIHPSDPVTAATKGNYAALGDSYASGEGANGKGPYLGASTKDHCHRAGTAFPEGLRKEFTFRGGSRFVACSSALTGNIMNGLYGEKSQLNALDPHTTTVTLSAGGDDLHFTIVMTKCVTDLHLSLKFWDPPKEDQCHAQEKNIEADEKRLFGSPPNPSRYEQMLEAIHRRAPNARILVSGYPHLFPDPPKKDYDTLNTSDQAFLNAKGRELNANIARQVQAEDSKWYGNGQRKMGGFEYVDNWNALQGHEITSEHPWINGLEVCLGFLDSDNPNCWNGVGGTGTFHPTPEGQRSMQRNYARELREGPGRTLYDP